MYDVQRIPAGAVKPVGRDVRVTGGEWERKSDPVAGKNSRKSAAAATTARRSEARPYPSAPVSARPGSVVAASILRTPRRMPGETAKAVPSGVRPGEYVDPLTFEGDGPARALRFVMSRPEQANALPFVPEYRAEGRPYPRVARDEHGMVVPRVRTDNGMTDKLKGRGIARREDGKPAYTRRQVDAHEHEREAQYAALIDQARFRQLDQDRQEQRAQAKQAIQAAMGRERDARSRGDLGMAAVARGEVRRLRFSLRGEQACSKS